MKYYVIVIPLFLITYLLQAQEAKPTKKQTVDFIKRYFEDEYFFRCDKVDMSYTVDDYIVDFNEGTNLFTIEYVWSSYSGADVYGKTKYRITIDMSKIDSVSRNSVISSSSCNRYEGYLNFQVASGSDYKIKRESINLEGFGSSDNSLKNNADVQIFLGCDSCLDKEKAGKLKKAFDHLRKLCGAPDPINFD